MFDEPLKLLLGLLTGFCFGFLLHKGQGAKFQTMLGQLLLKDFTVFKVMATAIAVGAVGVYALIDLGWASASIQTASMARILIGGTLFGIGMAIFGLCPGTSVASAGEGRRDSMVGILGMCAGAAIYVAAFGALEPIFKSLPDFGKVTLPQFTGTALWIWVGALAVEVLVGLSILERFSPRDLEATGARRSPN
jgi:uncharacterized membrane protein YedE/YeeE